MEGSVHRYEALLRSITKAWNIYVPNVSIEHALEQLDIASPAAGRQPPAETAATSSIEDSPRHQADYVDYSSPEHNNPEDFEFDESQDYGDGIDGMALLTLEPFRAG